MRSENLMGLGYESLAMLLLLKFLSIVHSLHTLHCEKLKIEYCNRNNIFDCWLGLIVDRLTSFHFNRFGYRFYNRLSFRFVFCFVF